VWAGHEAARTEAARRWRALPPERRVSYADCELFAQGLTYDLYFSTITNRLKLITAWLILELDADFRRTEARARFERKQELDARQAAFMQWQADYYWSQAA
jgi:hypothetical protein